MLWLSNTVWLHIFRPLRNTVCNICIHGHSFWIFTAIFRARTTFLWLNETLHLSTASVLQREAQGGHWTRQAIVTADSRVHIQSVKMVKLRIKILLICQTHMTLPWCWVGMSIFEIESQDKMMLYVQNILCYCKSAMALPSLNCRQMQILPHRCALHGTIKQLTFNRLRKTEDLDWKWLISPQRQFVVQHRTYGRIKNASDRQKQQSRRAWQQLL